MSSLNREAAQGMYPHAADVAASAGDTFCKSSTNTCGLGRSSAKDIMEVSKIAMSQSSNDTAERAMGRPAVQHQSRQHWMTA